jgi:DNA-binding response OmpR family regulator
MGTTAAQPVETILLGEDEPPIRRLIRRVLEGQGYQVLDVPNGQQAMVVAERHAGEIDLLVTDVTLPDLHGVDLAYCLGAIMKVLFVRRQDDAVLRPDLRRTSIPLNPFRADELQRSVRQVLDAGPLAA